MESQVGQAISIIGGLGGFSSLLWLVVDWARKDERQLQQLDRINRMESRLQAGELAHQQLQMEIHRDMTEIKRGLARIEGREEAAEARRRGNGGD